MTKVFRDSEWDRDGVIEGILGNVPIPRMAKVRQLFDETRVEDIPRAIEAEFNKSEIASTIKKDASIAITVGSRGIANLALIVREVVTNVKRLGAHPFVIPAMGSHGGATAAGQLQVLEGMGVTEEYIGAPILSSMETLNIGDKCRWKSQYRLMHMLLSLMASSFWVGSSPIPHSVEPMRAGSTR